ncbi:Uncharacterized conserved protein [Mycoavidus cysteinexigens]|uniref:Uncharacterized conserved protein n=1 Tax=Mycoavidus cysteinexigens TaxID=1553431 RepID=A0A2Z6EVT3_9BURK|nr:RES family NAD+ phosphorylase [Mycoavidus cysteinexigens]BBE09506.1 Uncharacterized conserved protein [Mycoavidus cysteinexigens]GAM51736.1 hypothetical protein EBME_0199 [bacterium endosymbiont of Mortierella elongata FMR23-6]GLR01328.1 hypothetical protein GCM10007934_11400 [Mycoavidus cysteinexigens]
MLTVWRIVVEQHAPTAFSGEGARLYGGRWNPKGISVIYTAQSQSLAALEMLAQDMPLRARYLMIPAKVPKQLIAALDLPQLPSNWREPAARSTLQMIGATWVNTGQSAVLAVPSVIIPTELNYILNPKHPDFPKIELGQPTPFTLDMRLLSNLMQ